MAIAWTNLRDIMWQYGCQAEFVSEDRRPQVIQDVDLYKRGTNEKNVRNLLSIFEITTKKSHTWENT